MARPAILYVILLSNFCFAASFQGLGDLAGGDYYCFANAVSADGSVVVGYSHSAPGRQAFRWTSDGGMVGLGDLPGGAFSSEAWGVSADGSIVIGAGYSASYPVSGFQAFRWTFEGGMVCLGDLSGGGFHSEAHSISADGSIVVGFGNSSGYEAFRWTSSGMVGLGDLPGGVFNSKANDISAAGSVVVGYGSSASGCEAFRWTSESGMTGLGDLLGGIFYSQAKGISASGTVVGYGYSESGREAFLWTTGGGMTGLGDLPGGGFTSEASAVCADGSIVVGYGSSASGQEACCWTASGGMQSIKDILTNEYGLDLSGWSLLNATGISGDGTTIVGTGINPNGFFEGWIAKMPRQKASAVIGLLKNEFEFQAFGIDSNTLSQVFKIANYGGVDLNWHIENDCDWLSVSPPTGQIGSLQSNEATISIDHNNIIGYGLHTCQFRVADPNAANSPQVITVRLNVLGPKIGVNKMNFDFTAYGQNDSNVANQQLIIANSGYDILNWHIEMPGDCDWLSVTPLSGQIGSLQLNEAIVSIDHNNIIDYGLHTCQFRVEDPNAANSPQMVTVRLNILGPNMSISVSELQVYAEINKQAQTAFQITNTGYDVLHWNAEVPPDCNWLKAEPNAGICARNEISEVTVTVDTSGLANGEYQSPILISSPQCSSKTVTFNLTVYTPRDIHVPQDYNTIQKAVDAAGIEDRIIVHPGTYAGFGLGSTWPYVPRHLVVQSIEPNNPEVVAATIINSRMAFYDPDGQVMIDGLSFINSNPQDPFPGISLSFSKAVIRNCQIRNFNAAGIDAYQLSSANNEDIVIENCQIINNGNIYSQSSSGYTRAGIVLYACQGIIKNCLITGNFGTGIYAGALPYGQISINNCTIADNVFTKQSRLTTGRGITWRCYSPSTKLSICNSVLSNPATPYPEIPYDIFVSGNNTNNAVMTVEYSDIKGGLAAISAPNDLDIIWGLGNIDADPCFISRGYWDGDRQYGVWVDGDYHLKSEGWSFDADANDWTWDDETSRCIDAGNPSAQLNNEPLTLAVDPKNRFGKNLRIDMGAYGGTAEASMAPHDWQILSDINNDGIASLLDFAHIAANWQISQTNAAGDVDRDGSVGISDFVLMADDWLKMAGWN